VRNPNTIIHSIQAKRLPDLAQCKRHSIHERAMIAIASVVRTLFSRPPTDQAMAGMGESAKGHHDEAHQSFTG